MQLTTCRSETLFQIYLDLSKAYDSIDRGKILQLLCKYKVGPRLRSYIGKVWDNQHFVLRQAQFYSKPVDIDRGVTQGDINSPIVFNVIVDAVLREWKRIRGEEEVQTESKFYSDDGLIESTDNVQLQKDADLIIELFKKVDLHANEKKTKYMIVRGAEALRAMSVATYDALTQRRKNSNKSIAYKEKKKIDVDCKICGKTLRETSLKKHMETQHKQYLKPKYQEREEDIEGKFVLWNYTKGMFNECSVPGYTRGGKETYFIYKHFARRHPKADIEIRGDRETVKCELCNTRCYNLDKHKLILNCLQLQERRRNETKYAQKVDADNVRFYVNGKEIERVSHFKYLGRWFDEHDDDTFAIMENLRKARGQWNCLVNILKREEANAVCMAKFYMAVVQAVLIYGAESWSITDRNMRRLRSFHHRVLRYLTGKHNCKKGELWEYTNH